VLCLVPSRLAQYPRTSAATVRRWPGGGWPACWPVFGDACKAAGDLPATRQARQQALHTLDDLGLPANRWIRARLEQARSLQPDLTIRPYEGQPVRHWPRS